MQDFSKYMKNYTKTWKLIFSIDSSVDIKKPLKTKILSDPNHKFVMTMLYIYSMNTFIFDEFNKASRSKDLSKIKFYGPYDFCENHLVHILHLLNSIYLLLLQIIILLPYLLRHTNGRKLSWRT